MPVDEIIAPHSYSAMWGILGGVLLLAVAIFWIVLWRAMRKARPQAAEQTPQGAFQPGVHDPWAQARSSALGKIDALSVQHAAGEVSSRDVHQELASIIRDFATARAGVDASTFTLTELSRHEPLNPATQLIEDLYHPEFSPQGITTPDDALQASRAAVGSW